MGCRADTPFVKLDDYFKKLFEKHIDDHNLHLLLVFGKNEGNESRSLGKNDFDFFKNFKNVSIIYEASLHAKYYGNEKKGVITSINLHDYSFKNNIEFGVYSEMGLLNSLANQSDKQAWEKCWEIADKGEAIFIKRPVYKKKFLNTLTGSKEYLKSEVLLDCTDSIYSYNSKNRTDKKLLTAFPDQLDTDSRTATMPTREQVAEQVRPSAIVVPPLPTNSNSIWRNTRPDNHNQTGYCIRTGVEIPFNPDRPYSADAYRSWARYENPDYKENFCHKTGRQSNGRTTMRNPVLN